MGIFTYYLPVTVLPPLLLFSELLKCCPAWPWRRCASSSRGGWWWAWCDPAAAPSPPRDRGTSSTTPGGKLEFYLKLNFLLVVISCTSSHMLLIAILSVSLVFIQWILIWTQVKVLFQNFVKKKFWNQNFGLKEAVYSSYSSKKDKKGERDLMVFIAQRQSLHYLAVLFICLL